MTRGEGGLARYSVPFKLSKKKMKVFILVIVGLPLTHRLYILQKGKPGTSHITHHTSHIAYYFFKFLVIVIKNSVALQHFITTDLKKVYQIFVDENHRINNTNA